MADDTGAVCPSSRPVTVMGAFIPPVPKPHEGRLSLFAKLVFARRNVLELLRERNYRMKMSRFRIPGLDIFVVNEPALVRRILVDEAERFPKGRLLCRTLEPVIGNAVFIANGEDWKRQRRMIDPAFNERRLEELFPLMNDAVEAMLGRLAGLAPGSVIDANMEMTHVTADIICRTLCSVPFSREGVAEVFGAFSRYQEAAPSFGLLRAFGLPGLLTPAGWRIRRAAKDVRRLVEGLIRDRYEAYQRGERDGRKDVLNALFAARDPETGEAFSFDELVRQLIVLFIAGHETTASTLSWAVYLIASCPDVQERIHREAVAAMGPRRPEFADLKQLRFTRDVLREALRLYPAVGFLIKEAAAPCQLRGQEVEAGSSVVVSTWTIHRHRHLWERPDEFDPDRFATASGKASLKRAYLPFSFGPRVCIGAGFAMQEAMLIIASLVRAFRLEPVPGDTPEPVARLTIRSPTGIRLRLEPRPAAGGQT